jgi:hypothetical protein
MKILKIKIEDIYLFTVLLQQSLSKYTIRGLSDN